MKNEYMTGQQALEAIKEESIMLIGEHGDMRGEPLDDAKRRVLDDWWSQPEEYSSAPFQFTGENGTDTRRTNKDGTVIGCLTQVKGGEYVGPNEAATYAIREDPFIPADISDYCRILNTNEPLFVKIWDHLVEWQLALPGLPEGAATDCPTSDNGESA